MTTLTRSNADGDTATVNVPEVPKAEPAPLVKLTKPVEDMYASFVIAGALLLLVLWATGVIS